MDFKDLKKIKDIVYHKNYIPRFMTLLLGVTLLAINYNLFLILFLFELSWNQMNFNLL